ncbi:MAG TPA: IS200/IS605 family transposase [Gemmataceae bacterium]|jgi:REP element-mobilizing transposase RayT
MPQSFGSIQMHLVFSTKGREPSIVPAIAERLYDYLGGTLRGNSCSSIAIGGVADHVHLLVSMSREFSTSQLVRVLKSNSSRWIHDTFPTLRGFAWQSGYGAFSVSYSQVEVVKAYILNQEEHHKRQSFQDEFLSLLRAHRLEWDERYVWD